MGVIYLLYNDEGYGYIGKTINIKKRILRHRDKPHNYTNSKKLGDTWKCEILEEIENDYLNDYEQYYYDMYNDLFDGMLVNKKRPLNTIKEYKEQNRGEIILKQKEWREQNKDEIILKQKEYYEKNKEELKLRTKRNYEQNKNEINIKQQSYREKNKEHNTVENRVKNNEYVKNYREKNADELKKKRGIMYDCECGGKYIIDGKNRHERTQKHIKYITN